MRHLFRPIAIHLRHLRPVLAFLCLVPTQPVVAGEFIPADNVDLYSRALADVPSAASEDMLTNPGDPPPNLSLRNSLIIGTNATLVAAYGSYNWWRTGFGGGFDTANEGWLGAGTNFGGADKLGHIYSNYAGVRLLTPLFESAGKRRGGAGCPRAGSAPGG